MHNFTYFTPTKVVFGKDTVQQLGTLVKEQHCKKVLIVYGGGSVKRSGLLDAVKSALDGCSLAHVELGGVVPNPRLGLVYTGIALAKAEGVDFLLAVGGGSVIDTAKAIAYGIANEGDVWDFFSGKRKASACAPVGVVLTIAATGSEMSNSAVITNEDGDWKRGYNDDLARPKFAIMDPQLTMSLPDYQTASGCTDILMHTFERYFVSGGTMELTDSMAEALMRTVITNSLILKDDPKNYEARAEIMWAGSLSHNGLTGCGIGAGDFVCHQLEHEMGAMYDVAHGAGLAAVWGSWARYVLDDCLHRFYRFAVNVMGVAPGEDRKAVALQGIEAMEQFFRAINMPTSMSELGIHPTDGDMRDMAHKVAVVNNGKKGSAKVLYEEDMYNIYRMAK